ncbi:MAG: hypothetical protein RIC55_35800 [Pirellulaceae bacterium]
MGEFLVLTSKGKLYRLVVLHEANSRRRNVSGLLLYGKGFAYRFDAEPPEAEPLKELLPRQP